MELGAGGAVVCLWLRPAVGILLPFAWLGAHSCQISCLDSRLVGLGLGHGHVVTVTWPSCVCVCFFYYRA